MPGLSQASEGNAGAEGTLTGFLNPADRLSNGAAPNPDGGFSALSFVLRKLDMPV